MKVHLRLLTLVFVSLAVQMSISTPAAAACSKTKICNLAKKQIDVADIAETCEMDESEVEEIIATCKKKKPARAIIDVPPRQAVCCDAFGNGRCPIIAGSTELGTSCFCPGQGYGVICR